MKRRKLMNASRSSIGRNTSTSRINCSKRKTVTAGMLSAKDLDPSSVEYALEKNIGRAVSRAKKFLKDLGFECTLVAGPTSNLSDTWEEWTTDGDNPGSLMAKLYFTLNRDGNRYTDGILTDVYVDQYSEPDEVESSRKVSCSTSKAGMETLSNGWVIQKIGSRWYLLSKAEYEKYADHLSDYPKDLMTDSFQSKSALIQQFLREPAYKHMFEASGYYLDDDWNVIRSSHKVSCSVKPSFRKHSVKASREAHAASIMAGAGSGITLELNDLEFTEVPDGGFYNEYNEYHDYLEPENGYCKGTVDIESIGTYYDGGNPNVGEIPVEIQVVSVYPDHKDIAQVMIRDSLRDAVAAIDDMEKKIQIGGGWTRSNFTGEFETDAYSYDATFKLKIKIEDEDLAKWLNEFAHGESGDLFYDIYINDNPNGNYYESLEDAIATAEEYANDPQYADDEITVVLEHYYIDYNGEIVGYYDDNGDVVWNSNDALYE